MQQGCHRHSHNSAMLMQPSNHQHFYVLYPSHIEEQGGAKEVTITLGEGMPHVQLESKPTLCGA